MRYQTLKMLDELGLFGGLHMTPSNTAIKQVCEDYKKVQAELKKEMALKIQSVYDVAFAIDDQVENCNMFNTLGISTLHFTQ